MKKVYINPVLRIVEVKNDIIATSEGLGTNNTMGNGIQLAPGRNGMWDEDFDAEDLY